MSADPNRRLTHAGLTIGIGLGGFVDGILLHQILQVHNMMSARIPSDTLAGAKANMVWDGLFHVLVWLATAAGIAMLFGALRQGTRPGDGARLLGAVIAGWGLFNLVEGAIDHHLLGLHHVVERLGLSAWDWAFLASGPLLILAGQLVARRGA